MKCSMTGFIISKDQYEFAGGKGIKVFFSETFPADGKERTQNVPVKVWKSTHGHELDKFVKGAHMTLHGFIEFRRFKKLDKRTNQEAWTDDIAFVLQDYEALPYERQEQKQDNAW